MAAQTILIVEDDPVARTVLQKALRSAGFEVAIAPDALSAISQARARRPALVVLDLGLPAGGGLAVMQRMQALPDLSVVPILVVSGQQREEAEPRALEAGAAAFLPKPADPAHVVAAVRRILSDAG